MVTSFTFNITFLRTWMVQVVHCNMQSLRDSRAESHVLPAVGAGLGVLTALTNSVVCTDWYAVVLKVGEGQQTELGLCPSSEPATVITLVLVCCSCYLYWFHHC